MRDKRNTTTVETRVDVKAALQALPNGTLTHEEERLLRMRSGTGLPPRGALELKGQNNAEVRAQLAMIEAQALEALKRRPMTPAATPEGEARKALIMRKLREPKA